MSRHPDAGKTTPIAAAKERQASQKAALNLFVAAQPMPRRRVKKALTKTQQRKKEHLEICLDTESVAEPHRAPGSIAIILSTTRCRSSISRRSISARHFSASDCNAPILISSMTGGFDLARKVNRNLAAAAQRLGIAMGVGSQRVAIEEPSAAGSFQVRDVAPDILLLGNLGAVQLNYGYTVEHCRRAVEMIGADALILHLNVLQEAVQPEGNRNFKGLTAKIAEVCRQLEVPVVAKEVGNGISVDVAVRLTRRRRQGDRRRRQRRHVVVSGRGATRG